MLVRTRLSTRNPGQITGYAVALPADTTRTGGPVWYSGGKLAPDPTLPKLRHRWNNAGPRRATADPRLTWAERDTIFDHAARAAATATEQIRYLSSTDPAAAADAAWAAADTLHAAASVLGSASLRQAADAYDRAARAPYGQIPRPTPAGSGLRRAARLLSAYGMAAGDRSTSAIRLVIRLAALAESIADLRQIQQRAAQAAAARTAAERLRSLTRPHTEPPSRGPRQGRPRTAAELVALGFPVGPFAHVQQPQGTPAQPRPTSRHPTAAPTRRGPAP